MTKAEKSPYKELIAALTIPQSLRAMDHILVNKFAITPRQIDLSENPGSALGFPWIVSLALRKGFRKTVFLKRSSAEREEWPRIHANAQQGSCH